MQKVGFGFLLGAMVGAVATLAFQRLRDREEIEVAEKLANEIQERLDLLESRTD